MRRLLPLALVLALGACSSVSGGKSLPMPQGGFTPLEADPADTANAVNNHPIPATED